MKTSLVRLDVAQFEDDRHAPRDIAEELTPEAPAMQFFFDQSFACASDLKFQIFCKSPLEMRNIKTGEVFTSDHEPARASVRFENPSTFRTGR